MFNICICFKGNTVVCQPLMRGSDYGSEISRYDTDYCANHIEAYDTEFRNATHIYSFSKTQSQAICRAATPARLWQNIIPYLFLVLAFVNYIPTLVANTFLREKLLGYLLFIKHSIALDWGEADHFNKLQKMCFKWQGTGLARAFFALSILRLFLLIGELVMFFVVDGIRIDLIRQDFICCVDAQDPVRCTFSKYYTLLFIWVVSVAAIFFSLLITLRSIYFLLFRIRCSCQLCHTHTRKLCKVCFKSWCPDHGEDGCQRCGRCTCQTNCKSHVYARISGLSVPCSHATSRNQDESVGYKNAIFVTPENSNIQMNGEVAPKSSQLTLPLDDNDGCCRFPRDYQVISHLAYANSHTLNLLTIMNVMDNLADDNSAPSQLRIDIVDEAQVLARGIALRPRGGPIDNLLGES